MRLFVGIPLADAVLRELAAVVARLRKAEGAGRPGAMRWTAPESWHITLQFLGNATEEQFECLRARLGEVRSAPVPARLGELGCFDRAGVLFAGVQVSPELAELQKRVAAATSQCGFAAEARVFHPHITLARAKGEGRGTGLRELQGKVAGQPAFAGFTAREFLLYESHLGPGGAQYEVRMRVRLEGG
ncbi:MAG: RNA 2',3'-cyclic phosphodiesterase [Terracidiphilus sp.]